MNISFYVLSTSKAQDFLGFICQLTQTALNKSEQSLLILVSDETQLTDLDEALWSEDASSFIPHQRLHTRTESDSSHSDTESLAPVILGDYLPAAFTGIVINTTSRPVTDYIDASHQAKPSRILEIIKPDESSMAEGRHKYKTYQQAGYLLTHFKV